MGRVEAERGATENVGGLLAETQGITVSRTASISAAPILRGLTGSSVLLMSDELRLNDSLTRAGGNALLNLLDPESVEQIEVVRGPASVLYGSDALGGAVRVKKRGLLTGEQAPAQVGGSLFARGSWADLAVRTSSFLYGVNGIAGGFVSGGIGRAGMTTRGGGKGEQPFTGHHDGTFATRLQLSPAPEHDLSLIYQSGHQWDVPRSDNSTEMDEQRTAYLLRDAVLLRYTGDLHDRKLRVNTFAGFVARRELRERRRRGGLEQERDQVYSGQLGASVSFLPAAGTNIDVGVDAVLERIGSSALAIDAMGATQVGRGRYLDGSRYDTAALYALWSQRLWPAWTLLVGARGTLVYADAPLDPLFAAGVQKRLDRTLLGAVGSVGVRFDATRELSWVLSGLSGFRAPNLEDFQAFGGGARGFTVPITDLHEERSYTLETGIKLGRPELQMSMFTFASVLTGLIVRVPSTWGGEAQIQDEPVLRRENASRALLVGAEGHVSARLPHGFYTSVAGTAVWGETRRTAEDGGRITEPATKVPGPQGALRFGYGPPNGPVYIELAGVFQMSQSRLSESDKLDVRLCPAGPGDCTRVKGYVNLALRAGLRMNTQLAITAVADNLLDVDYKHYASGAYATGRNFILGIRGTM